MLKSENENGSWPLWLSIFLEGILENENGSCPDVMTVDELQGGLSD